MKKSIVIIFLFCVVSNFSFAQNIETPLQQTWTVSLWPFGAGIVGEFPLSDKSTFKGEIFGLINFGINGGSNRDTEVSTVGLSNVNANYRYYYKFKNTNRKGKPLLFNSGNYVFGRVSSTFLLFETNDDVRTNFDSNEVVAGAGWGIQRMYQNRFVFAIGVGAGYNFSEELVTLLGEFTIGIRLKPGK